MRWDGEIIYACIISPTHYECLVVEAVNNLPPLCRKAVILFACELIPKKDVATILQLSLMTVRFLIHRSGLMIREYLEDHGKHNTADAVLKEAFAGWPYREYTELVKLRKNLVVLK